MAELSGNGQFKMLGIPGWSRAGLQSGKRCDLKKADSLIELRKAYAAAKAAFRDDDISGTA
jgi:hypothetical protein